MATIGQIYYNVLDNNSGEYISSGIDIFADIVSGYQGAKRFNKVGVQAPPGTRMIMNDSKNIMVGRTGIYELDDDIAITKMVFVHPYNYVLDEEASAAALEEGGNIMRQAEATRENELILFHQRYPVEPDRERDEEGYKAYWNEYNRIQAAYIEEYNRGLNIYNRGVNGIYRLPNPSNPDAKENFKDLYNIIVDFIYE